MKLPFCFCLLLLSLASVLPAQTPFDFRKGLAALPFYGPDAVLPKDYKSGQSAQDAAKNMTLPPGFKAEVVVAEPDVVQPIAMCFDERGRLWVAEGMAYPQKRKGEKGPDRILIFEDTKGTGNFDKRTVFIEGLNLVSGMEVGFGGVWVGAAPEMLFIPKDANDKPGAPQVLLDGFGLGDTHETLNSFIWGPDGWLYGCHGVFTYSKVGKPGTPDELRTPMNAGVWRYHPVRHEFEVFAHGTSNPWGLDYDEHGEFFITACVIPHLYHIVPGGRYQRQGGQHYNPYTYDDIKTIADHAHYAGNIKDNAHWGDHHSSVNLPVANDTNEAGGGHAHCGLCIYQGDNFPPEYRGELLFGNLHGHRLVHDHVEPNGSTFTGQHRADFMRSNDFWFIPIQQKLGPDGALYVSDWSDKQVCHQGSNAVDAWDRSNGRIYRISYGDAKPRKMDLTKLNDLELAKMAVEDTNEYFVRQARKVLMERAAAANKMYEASNALNYALEREPIDSAKRLKALWALHSMASMLSGEYSLTSHLRDAQESIRWWSVRLLAQDQWLGLITSPAGKEKIGFVSKEIEAGAFHSLVMMGENEKAAIVRRELASLLQRLPLDKRSDIATALLAHVEDANDPVIPLLIWYGIEPVVGADAGAGMKLAAASKMDKVTGFIYRRLSTDEKGRVALLRAAADMPDAARREKTLAMIVDSARGAGKLATPSDWSAIAAKLRANASPNARNTIDELSALFGDANGVKIFRETLKHPKADDAVRDHAIAVLVQVRDPLAAKVLQILVTDSDTPSPLRRKCIQALVALPDTETAGELINSFVHFTADEKTDAVSTLASTRDGATALLQAIASKKIDAAILTPYLVRQIQTLNNANVNVLLAKAMGGTVNPAKPDIAQQKAKWQKILTPAVLKAADKNKGHEIFRGTCATCHKLFGEGANVGPDITGSNRANLDYLLDNVLDPSAVIGKGYELNVFTMKDARVIGGIVKEESDAGFKVAMPGGIELVLNKPEVSKRDILKISMMPEGQFDALGAENVANLVVYLQSNAPSVKSAGAIKVEGAIEGETMKVLSVTGGVTKSQGMGNYKNSRWSGNDHLWWSGAKVGDVLTLALPVEAKGNYAIKAVLTKARDYGIVEISLDGKPLPDGKIDLFNTPDVINSGELDWGTHELDKGEHKLEVKSLGSNPQAQSGHMFGLDYVKLEKK